MTRMKPPAGTTGSQVRVLTALFLLALISPVDAVLPRRAGELAGGPATTPVAGASADPTGPRTEVLAATETKTPPTNSPDTRTAPRNFSLTGTILTPLVPGASRPLDVVIANPGDADLEVTAITVAIGGPEKGDGSPNPDCPVTTGTPNIVVAQSFAGTVVVPAGRTMALSALGVPQDRWPVVAMPNLAVNQDACQNTTFPLVLTGSGRVA